jgi:hypothetical protein
VTLDASCTVIVPLFQQPTYCHSDASVGVAVRLHTLLIGDTAAGQALEYGAAGDVGGHTPSPVPARLVAPPMTEVAEKPGGRAPHSCVSPATPRAEGTGKVVPSRTEYE